MIDKIRYFVSILAQNFAAHGGLIGRRSKPPGAKLCSARRQHPSPPTPVALHQHLLITNPPAATAPAPQQPGMVHASGVNATATTGGMTASGVNSLRRAADEELKYNSEVCFLPIPGSCYDTATARGIAGFVGFAQGSNKICGVWRTVVEMRACLCPYVRDQWICDVRSFVIG